MRYLCIILVIIVTGAKAQQATHPFAIRTITAGINLKSLDDTTAFMKAVAFLEEARRTYERNGYTVQTLRISTQHFYKVAKGTTLDATLPHLVRLDKIAKRHGIMVAIGAILGPDEYNPAVPAWAAQLVQQTENINFSMLIASQSGGIYHKSTKAAAEVAVALSTAIPGGEGNFRFTASANCPSGIPFFPAAFHEGPDSFAIGLESAGVLTSVFEKTGWNETQPALIKALESHLLPVERIAAVMARQLAWQYDGIDTSPAPGLNASIGEAIETLTGQPFGSPSTLRACSLITGALKGLSVKTCGYSGLMLPVIEDKILALRAAEGRFTIQELLLYSSVSGTGLDVVPLPGDTPVDDLIAIYEDVAALSLKYTNKALSARLFLMPGKKAGDPVVFTNAFLTGSVVLPVR